MAASWRICKANQREGKLQFVRHEAQRSYVAHVVRTFDAGDRGLVDWLTLHCSLSWCCVSPQARRLSLMTSPTLAACAAARIALVASSAGILAMSNLPAPQVLLRGANPRVC